MPRPKTITPKTIKQIRELFKLGVPKARIARELGVAVETVRRYSDPEQEAAIKAMQRRRYERERNMPEVVERRRGYAREYARREREKAKQDPEEYHLFLLVKRTKQQQRKAKKNQGGGGGA